MPQDLPNDQQWLASLRDGDDSALNPIMENWEGPLFAFAWRYVQNITDAQDLVAEVFVRLHQQREKLRADTKLSAWLYTVLTHLCHNHHRWRKRHPSVGLDTEAPASGKTLADGLACALPRPDQQLEATEKLEQLRNAIDALPHDLKTTLILHHYEQLSYRAIAAIMDCSERGVETRLYRARQKLKELLQFTKDPEPPIAAHQSSAA